MTITHQQTQPHDTHNHDTLTDTTIEVLSQDGSGPQIIRPEVRTTLWPDKATTVGVSTSSGHSFVIDEPASLGGEDLGANPVEHLLAALGACQVITYQVWAGQLGIRVDSVDVRLAGTIDLRGFFGLDDGVRPGFDAIELEVRLGGPEDDATYADLVRQVDAHCPVLDSVTGPVPVTARFVRA